MRINCQILCDCYSYESSEIMSVFKSLIQRELDAIGTLNPTEATKGGIHTWHGDQHLRKMMASGDRVDPPLLIDALLCRSATQPRGRKQNARTLAIWRMQERKKETHVGPQESERRAWEAWWRHQKNQMEIAMVNASQHAYLRLGGWGMTTYHWCKLFCQIVGVYFFMFCQNYMMPSSYAKLLELL